MKKRPAAQKYFNVLTSNENTESATILLYGYIGEAYDWYTGEQVGITDIDFVKELEALAAKYSTIHIRINSPGGEVYHGSAIVTAIQNCKAEVHTWIDGVAASMAGVIWMSGKKRHMAKNAMLMLHSASNICWGNAKEMREVADTLDKFDSALVISAAAAVGMSEEAMREKYFNYQDHWLTYNDVNEEKWLTEPDDYPVAAKLPTDMTKMDYRELVAFFNELEPEEGPSMPPNWLDKAREIFEEAKREIKKVLDPPSQSQTDMNILELEASIKDGRLKLDEVKNFIATLEPAPTPDPTPEEEEEDEAESPAVTALRAEMTAMRNEFTAQLKALGGQPGAGKSTPAPTDSDAPSAEGTRKTDKQLLDEENAKMFAAAQSGDTVMFTPAIPKD